MTMRAPRSLVAAAGLFTVLLLAACSGSGTGLSASGTNGPRGATSPQRWLRELCLGFNRVDDDLNGGNDITTDDPSRAKAQLADAFGSARRDASDLQRRLEAAGPPAVEDGAAIHRLVLDRIEALTGFTTAALRRIQMLPTDSSAFVREANKLKAFLEREGEAAGKRFPRPKYAYPKGARVLEGLAKHLPACAGSSLFSDSGGSTASSS